MSKKRKCETCMTCANCQYICEGDFICDVAEPVLVIEDFTPTDEYYLCGGSEYEPNDEDDEDE